MTVGKIAILGGSFDPPHLGHVAIARAALAAGADRVVWMPAAASPFKQARPPATALDRWAMVVLATLDEPRFVASRVELDRPPPSFSIETAIRLEAEIAEADATLWWIVGADHLAEIGRWHRVEDLVQLVRLAVVPRHDLRDQALLAAVERLPERIRSAVDVLPMPVVTVSSTEIRRQVRQTGEIPANTVVPGVSQYIARYGLYRDERLGHPPASPGADPAELAVASGAPGGSGTPGSGLRALTLEERIMDQLVRELPRGRLRHVLGVAGTAAELAERFGADPQKARTAGLLHDIVRLWPPERLLAACQERGLSLSDFDLEHPVVRLHGLLASHLAEEWFGIEDADIKAAIASHTVGRPQMSRLERILYVADYCEPSRGPQAEDVRVAARNDLDAAVRLAMDRTIAYLLERGRAIHPEAVAARNAFLGDSIRAGPTPRS